MIIQTSSFTINKKRSRKKYQSMKNRRTLGLSGSRSDEEVRPDRILSIFYPLLSARNFLDERKTAKFVLLFK